MIFMNQVLVCHIRCTGGFIYYSSAVKYILILNTMITFYKRPIYSTGCWNKAYVSLQKLIMRISNEKHYGKDLENRK